jgi:hypothetical protein
LKWGRAPAGGRTVGRGWGGGREHLRSRTPIEFRDLLLAMARGANPNWFEELPDPEASWALR